MQALCHKLASKWEAIVVLENHIHPNLYKVSWILNPTSSWKSEFPRVRWSILVFFENLLWSNFLTEIDSYFYRSTIISYIYPDMEKQKDDHTQSPKSDSIGQEAESL